VAAGQKSRKEVLQLNEDVRQDAQLAVWTAWRDDSRSWLDSTPVESTASVPTPLVGDAAAPGAGELTDEFEIYERPPLADEPFFYDSVLDRFEWSDNPKRGYSSIIPRLESEGRDHYAMIAGRVFADKRVDIYSDQPPFSSSTSTRLREREGRRMIARARVEGLERIAERKHDGTNGV
jgi:hypothetical protein